MALFYCPDCEKKVDYVRINGYSLGERLLEGCPAKIFLRESSENVSDLSKEDFTVVWPDNEHLMRLNLPFFTNLILGAWKYYSDGYFECPKRIPPNYECCGICSLHDSLEEAKDFYLGS